MDVGYILLPSHYHREGVNLHYKGIYIRVSMLAGMGYSFQASKYMNWYTFHVKSISMGYHFDSKSIWIGKMRKIVYE